MSCDTDMEWHRYPGCDDRDLSAVADDASDETSPWPEMEKWKNRLDCMLSESKIGMCNCVWFLLCLSGTNITFDPLDIRLSYFACLFLASRPFYLCKNVHSGLVLWLLWKNINAYKVWMHTLIRFHQHYPCGRPFKSTILIRWAWRLTYTLSLAHNLNSSYNFWPSVLKFLAHLVRSAKVSFCDTVNVCRAVCLVRHQRASSVISVLPLYILIQSSSNLLRMLILIIPRSDSNMGGVRSKCRSLGQILVKPCYHSTGCNFNATFFKLSQNVYPDNTSFKLEYGWDWVRK